MNTDALISLLATNELPVRASTGSRLSIALAVGTAGALGLMFALIGVRADLSEALLIPMFWVKLGFPVSLAAAGFVASSRLARPGMAPGSVHWAFLVPVLIIWVLAIRELSGSTSAEREALVFGETWRDCLIFVSLLSLPAFVAGLWAMRGLAPTRPRISGAAAGILAGALAAAAYAFHCPEMQASFLGIWYLLGMLIPSVAGAIIGPRVLRW